jgi:PAS domain S-box-containing protein
MNPSSKRYLLTLGPLICLAIALLCLTEYILRNADLDEQASSQIEVTANRLSSNLQTALRSANKKLLHETVAVEFQGADLAAVLIWSANHEYLLYGIQSDGHSLAAIEAAPQDEHLRGNSFTIPDFGSQNTTLGSIDVFVDLKAFKKRQYHAVAGTAFKTAAVAFPLLLLAIYILDKQEKIQVKALRESILKSTRKERTHSENILEGTEAGTWDWNLQTAELSLNERWAEIIGYTLEELEPINLSTWEKTVHPEDLQKAQIRIEQHLSGILQYYDIEFRQLHKDGTWRWINARGKITDWTEAGVPLRMSGTHLNITERKLAEEANEASRQLLQTVFDAASGVSVIATDPHGVITLFNSGAERMLGYLADEMVGKATPFMLHVASEMKARGIPLEDVEEQTPEGYMERVLEVGRKNPEWTYVCKDGATLPVKLSITATHNAMGEVTGYLGAAMDISIIKQAQADLLKAKEEAEAASKAKDEFLAVMSHEMRTPLNPILGYADMLQQNITTKPETEYIETIIGAAHRQLRLIDDILEYMRINGGQITPNPEPFSLVNLCQVAVSDAQSLAGDLQLVFANNPNGQPVPEGLTVESDLMMLRRILDNLLDNACKYTHEGSIKLCLSRSTTEESTFIIAITDTGIGIDIENQQKLFDAFSQADSSYSRKHEGLGLGLAICRKLLTALGGNIEVASEVDVGSTFTVHLPLHEVPTTLPEKATAPTRDMSRNFPCACSILVVDDKADNRLLARTIAESFGARVIEAANGQEALDQCQQQKFEIILMDLAMPIMDGREATKCLRCTENPNQMTPVIAVTADVTPHVQQRCIRAGMQQYISKPINPQKLFKMISDFI